jgi:K(+)-stimulated pyrophosphate-energized sodium pump
VTTMPFMTALLIALSAAGLVLVFGLFLLGSTELGTTPQQLMLQLLRDGLKTLQSRVTASVLQFILYMTGILYAGGLIFHVHMSPTLFISAWIGAAITLIGASLCLRTASPIIRYIFSKSTMFYEISLTSILKAACGLSATLFGLTTFGLISVIIAFGLPASVGYCVGVAAAAVCIKIGSSIFKSSSMNGLAIGHRIRPKQPTDARNPGALLDIMGNLASNLSGFLSDLLTSFCLTFASCFLFITHIFQGTPLQKDYFAAFFVLIFTVMLLLTPLSLLLSFIRIRVKHSGNVLLEAVYMGIALCCLGIWGLSHLFAPLIGQNTSVFQMALPFLTGILGAAIIGFTAEYLTTDHFPPTKYLAKLAERSGILVTKEGISYGFLSNGIYFIYLALIAIITFSYAGFFGLILATLGMVSVIGPVMAVTAVSPIAESAHKLAILGENHPNIVQNLKRAAKLGTTTVALQSGFMSATSTLASASMIATLIALPAFATMTTQWLEVAPMAGFIIGMSIPYIVSGLILKRDQYATATVIDEINRQFDEIPFLIDKKAKPDVVKAADKLARIANDSLIFPVIVMALVPIAVAFWFGSNTLLAVAIGVFLSATLSGYHWSITGDSLLQAKGYIENGHLGGHGTNRHHEATTAGLIGTAFGEVLSPSSAVLMKAVTIITVLLTLFLSQ